MVTYEDYATNKVYRFLTNNMEYEPLTISELYRKDGTWNFTLNGLSNTFTSNLFTELPRMPYICKSGLPYAHTYF